MLHIQVLTCYRWFIVHTFIFVNNTFQIGKCCVTTVSFNLPFIRFKKDLLKSCIGKGNWLLILYCCIYVNKICFHEWIAVIYVVTWHHSETREVALFCGDHFVYAPRQWEMMLHSNLIFNWLRVYTKWFLICRDEHILQRINQVSFLILQYSMLYPLVVGGV